MRTEQAEDPALLPMMQMKRYEFFPTFIAKRFQPSICPYIFFVHRAWVTSAMQFPFKGPLLTPPLQSDNNDFCAACNTSGYLLCCDGCDKSFHFGCLDPPLTQNASELDEPWYCFGCIAKREQPQRRSRGLFAPLLSNLDKRNPSVFLLPQEIRDYFDGVATTKDGRFVEQLATKTR